MIHFFDPHRGLAAAALLLLSYQAMAAPADEPRGLQSPEGRIRVVLRMPPPGSTQRPHWDALLNERLVLTNCSLGITTRIGGERMAGVQVVAERRASVDETVEVLFGKSAQARNRFQEVRWTLESPRGHRTEVVFRCFDDAVALRYELPAEAPTTNTVIADESTSFQAAGQPMAYVQYLENFRTSHEHPVTPTAWQDIRPGELLDLPLTLAWPDGATVAITEAALRRYAGMALMRPRQPLSDASQALVCQLTPRTDGSKVVGPLPLRTPWRVALIADRPGALLESQTLYVLNDPPAVSDTRWIRPGKITFHWWNGDVYDGTPGDPILSVGMARRYIDFCARHGIAAHSLTSTEVTTTPWYRQTKPGVEPGPDTDVTQPREGFDLAAIRSYAESKGVRLWSWVHHAALRGRIEEAFAAFERLGWSGLMVDFFDHDDQETVERVESILAAAARHHILIHLHGVWKPTGLQRTYPNLMNHEGALNLEYLKWSDQCTPEHNLRMAFTRLIAGPMDYHLGGFRAVPKSEFQPRHVAPQVLGTRAHMLAMYVCFDNPMPMVADYPTAYEGQPGFDFLKRVPTWWDETRVIIDRIGEQLVMARRRGSSWYLGGLTASSAPATSIPLAFLPPGRFTASIWRDAPESGRDPNRLTTESREVSSADIWTLDMPQGGGLVAELVRLEGE